VPDRATDCNRERLGVLAGIDNEQTRQCKKVVRRQRIQRLEISANIAEVYGASVSRETVSKITDQVLEDGRRTEQRRRCRRS
jgi:hypothetical protein